LTTRFQDSENVRLYHQDFLTWRLPKDGASPSALLRT
jgi:hypothetical protein